MWMALWMIGGVVLLPTATTALNIVLAGGTGPIGQALVSQLHEQPQSHKVTILARNAFLAATPSRVSEDWGWVGASFLKKYQKTVKLRDWDGGDLLDIVGQDFLGWQEDTLKGADCVIHLSGGGFTEQRVMACERLVRESMSLNADALHITVNPTEELLPYLSPGLPTIKLQRIQKCEDMVQKNLPNHICLRINDRRISIVCDEILAEVEDWEQSNSKV